MEDGAVFPDATRSRVVILEEKLASQQRQGQEMKRHYERVLQEQAAYFEGRFQGEQALFRQEQAKLQEAIHRLHQQLESSGSSSSSSSTSTSTSRHPNDPFNGAIDPQTARIGDPQRIDEILTELGLHLAMTNNGATGALADTADSTVRVLENHEEVLFNSFYLAQTRRLGSSSTSTSSDTWASQGQQPNTHWRMIIEDSDSDGDENGRGERTGRGHPGPQETPAGAKPTPKRAPAAQGSQLVIQSSLVEYQQRLTLPTNPRALERGFERLTQAGLADVLVVRPGGHATITAVLLSLLANGCDPFTGRFIEPANEFATAHPWLRNWVFPPSSLSEVADPEEYLGLSLDTLRAAFVACHGANDRQGRIAIAKRYFEGAEAPLLIE